ncbi:capsule assembly Wzi family protein [Telluribacter humicola]|uniref:capsule assembly Wzi family protein n=1 Tax=Telluribacter humicola TaxID=1720261 RepID=UPI001A97B80D|nr:capsule assembly Wzi family protein [Telluribacter humicola]
MSLVRLCASIFFLLSSLPLFAWRSSLSDTSHNYIELAALQSSIDRTPFWHQANQFGIVPREGSVISLRAGVDKLWTLSTKSLATNRWKAGFGMEAVGNTFLYNKPGISTKSGILLPQAYGTVRHGNWELYAGRKKQYIGLADSTLGTGSYAWSGNALPIPKVQLGLTQFTTVPYTHGWLAVQGFVAHGWFENNRPITKDLKFHQKALYFRLANPNGNLKLYGGMNHQAQWGGKTPYETTESQMPNRFSDFLRVVIGDPFSPPADSSYHSFDNARVGNHLGTVDLGLELEGYGVTWFLYRQNIYEDGSLFRLKNIKDGLNGIRIRRKNFYGANFELAEGLFEILYTKNQAGTEFIFNQGVFGRDNYFNHAQVRDGWSYYDRTIGTPFIPPTTDTSPLWPAYSYTSNNRVWVLHLGLKGTFFQKYVWSTKLSYSSNAGTYDLPFKAEPTQFSGLLTIKRKVGWLGGNTFLQGSIATDVGELYRNSTGFMLSIRKEGLF